MKSRKSICKKDFLLTAQSMGNKCAWKSSSPFSVFLNAVATVSWKERQYNI